MKTLIACVALALIGACIRSSAATTKGLGGVGSPDELARNNADLQRAIANIHLGDALAKVALVVCLARVALHFAGVSLFEGGD